MSTVRIWHGRLDPKTGGTDEDGNAIEGWGFDGPFLFRVSGITYTYGDVHFHFEDAEACAAAKAKTGWKDAPFENALEAEFEEDCVRIFNTERNRKEFFGDFDQHKVTHPTADMGRAFIQGMMGIDWHEWYNVLLAAMDDDKKRHAQLVETLQRVMAGKPINDIEALGLAWWLRMAQDYKKELQS